MSTIFIDVMPPSPPKRRRVTLAVWLRSFTRLETRLTAVVAVLTSAMIALTALIVLEIKDNNATSAGLAVLRLGGGDSDYSVKINDESGAWTGCAGGAVAKRWLVTSAECAERLDALDDHYANASRVQLVLLHPQSDVAAAKIDDEFERYAYLATGGRQSVVWNEQKENAAPGTPLVSGRVIYGIVTGDGSTMILKERETAWLEWCMDTW